MQTISNMLVTCRTKCQLTQEQLCTELSLFSDEFASLTPVTLSRWENGASRASLLRKRLFIKYIISKGLLKEEPFYSIIKERLEALPEPLSTVFDHNYESIIHNFPDFGAKLEAYEYTRIDDATGAEVLAHIIDIEVASHAQGYYQTSAQQLRTLCEHPSSFSLLIERNGQHLGHFIMYKLKPESAEKVVHHTLSEHDISLSDLVTADEVGSYYVHAFFAVNPLLAAVLNTQAYLHFFENFETIDDIVVLSSRKDGVRLARSYGIELQDKGFDERYSLSWHGMSSPVADILFSDTVLKSVF